MKFKELVIFIVSKHFLISAQAKILLIIWHEWSKSIAS